MARQIKQENSYQSRLLKLIPTEIVAAFLAISGFIPDDYLNARILMTLVSIVLLLLIPFYLYFLQGVKGGFQIAFTSISFIIWVYSIGGPFIYWGIHDAIIGSALLVIWTLLIPFFTITPKPITNVPSDN